MVVIQPYILVSKLKKIKKKFLRCSGYLISIKNPIKQDLLLILVFVRLSKLLTLCLTAVKKHVIKYCEKVYERSGKNLFWFIKNSGEILDKLKARDFNATNLSTYDFSTLYTTLPHNLFKDKSIALIERTFKREGSPYLTCNDRNVLFTSEKPKQYRAWSCENVCDALTLLLDNIFIRFGTKLYRQVVGIPLGTNCAPLVADLFLFCYERDFMMSLSDAKQANVIDAFNTTSRYLDDILNINNVYFDNMVSQIYPSELQLNKANTSDAKAAFLDLHLSISNDIVSTKNYDKRDYFDFEIVNFPFSDGDSFVLHPMESISLNSFGLLEHLAMLLTSTLAINC